MWLISLFQELSQSCSFQAVWQLRHSCQNRSQSHLLFINVLQQGHFSVWVHQLCSKCTVLEGRSSLPRPESARVCDIVGKSWSTYPLPYIHRTARETDPTHSESLFCHYRLSNKVCFQTGATTTSQSFPPLSYINWNEQTNVGNYR